MIVDYKIFSLLHVHRNQSGMMMPIFLTDLCEIIYDIDSINIM